MRPRGGPLPGVEAGGGGLVNRAVPFERLEETVQATARQLASIPASQLAAMKLVVNQAYAKYRQVDRNRPEAEKPGEF